MIKYCFILLFFCFITAYVFCIDLRILVIDRDLEIPLEGVRIIEVNTGSTSITDAEGKASIEIMDGLKRVVIVAELIGYEDRKILVSDPGNELVIEMLMEGVLEGQELVVEEEAIGETDEEVGVSNVVEEEFIESASKIGLVEDLMSAIKILPGVTYTGAYGASLSVRGGDPSGLTVMLDGFVVHYPYHWGGMFSIFNPNIVDSVKFSSGIFSSKYGQATSGIMEVTTVTPNEGVRVEAVSSTSTLELFLQLPFGQDDTAGVFAGFRLTNYDLIFSILELAGEAADNQDFLNMLSAISRVPYIYDFYLKTFYRPSERFEWYINGFFGNDGIGSTIDNSDLDTSEEIVTDFDFQYFNTDTFVSTGVKLLPTDNLFIHILGGYEYWITEVDAYIREHGTHYYSDDFIDVFGSEIPPGAESFTVDLTNQFDNDILKHAVQARCDFDLTLHKDYLLQWGLGLYSDLTDYSQNGEIWVIDWENEGPYPVYRKIEYSTETEGSSIIDSFVYINLNGALIPEVLSLNCGTRLDHSYFIGHDDYTLNTYPVLCPRLNIVFTPAIDGDFFTKNSFSIGAGLFSKNPYTTSNFAQDLGLEDFDLEMSKTFMSVIGWETFLPMGYRFKIEGYYKYMYDRFYFNVVPNALTGETELFIHNDGYGNSAGFDLILSRKISRYFDGMLSYTFNYAQFKYPQTDGLNPEYAQRDIWLYPNYHRFHSFNLFFNIRPTNSITFTTKMSFATGTPKEEFSDKVMFPAIIENEDGTTTVAEMYARESYYSDTLRNNFSLPLDIKYSVHDYYKNSKIKWEFYFAVENLLAPLWSSVLPEDNLNHSMWSGEEQVGPSPSFDIPVPSIGFSLSY